MSLCAERGGRRSEVMFGGGLGGQLPLAVFEECEMSLRNLEAALKSRETGAMACRRKCGNRLDGCFSKSR